jgi:hypothetical protein
VKVWQSERGEERRMTPINIELSGVCISLRAIVASEKKRRACVERRHTR